MRPGAYAAKNQKLGQQCHMSVLQLMIKVIIKSHESKA